jgi:hypothetical protein
MINKSVSIEPVVKSVTVACTPEEAFRYFTADISIWWPVATQSVVAYASDFKDTPEAVIFEPRGSAVASSSARAPAKSTSGEPC